MKKVLMIGISLLFGLFLANCQPQPAVITPTATPVPPSFSYKIGACDQQFLSLTPAEREKWKTLHWKYANGRLVIDQNVMYVCCAKIQASMAISDRTITIREENVGEVCKCQCGYHFHGEIANLPPGHYQLQLLGVKYKEVHPWASLGKAEIDIPAPQS